MFRATSPRKTTSCGINKGFVGEVGSLLLRVCGGGGGGGEGGAGGEKHTSVRSFVSFHPTGHFSQEVVLCAMDNACKLCTMHKASLVITVYSELFEVILKLCWGRKTCFCQQFCVLSSDWAFLTGGRVVCDG